MSTESRCTGHCCKRFAIEHSYAELQADYAAWQRDPASARIPDVEKIAPMVIPLTSSRDGAEHVYACKNLRSNGDCGIYEVRPRMCRDFPTRDEGCHFWRCRSSQSAYYGMSLPQKLVRRWRWLRKLARKQEARGEHD
jgi:Fe-S-cluster containining protein